MEKKLNKKDIKKIMNDVEKIADKIIARDKKLLVALSNR